MHTLLPRARRAARGVIHPGAWLVVLAVGVFLYWHQVGYLRAHRHADSYSYANMAEPVTLPQVLAYHRTPGYPALVRLLRDSSQRRFDLRFQDLIVLQAATYLAAAWLLWWAASRYLGSRWLAFAFVLPLPFAGVVRTLSNLGPDFLAAGLIVAAAALLLWVARRRPRWWALAPFAIVLFVSYQMRPAGMFLVGFFPLAAVVLHRAAGGVGARQLARLGGAVLLATLVPFLAYSTLRWAVVGHFGVVSFTGLNHSALAMCFLDRRLARELPTDFGPLARQVLKKRENNGWRAMGPHDDPAQWFEQYSDNIWKIAWTTSEGAVQRAAGTPPGTRPFRVEQDAQMGALAKEILLRRPGLYAKWFRAAVGFGLRQLRNDLWLVVPFLLLVVSMPFALWWGGTRPARPSSLVAERRRRLAGLALVSVGYFCVYLALVSLVSFPFDRYLTSMTLFLPGLLCALLFELWSSLPTAGTESSPAAGG